MDWHLELFLDHRRPRLLSSMRSLWLPLLLAAQASASSSGSRFPIPPGSYGLNASDCLDRSHAATVDKVMSFTASGRRLSSGSASTMSRAEAVIHIREYCASSNGACPAPAHIDVQFECSDHSVHSFASDFNHMLKKRLGLMWNIFFVICALLFGALFRMCFPTWLPYTVGLLIVGMLAGGIGQLAATQPDCPMYAMKYDYDGDGYISRTEWEGFTCVGCHAASYCATAGKGFGAAPYISSCGDGSPEAPGCGFGFDWLDSPWKLSSMHAEAVYEFPHGSGSGGGGGGGSGSGSGSSSRRELRRQFQPGRPDMSRASFPAGDGRLSPDELWTPGCNLFLDIISLKDIDPHLMLVVFLPALLFESACFGIDMGIFLKQ